MESETETDEEMEMEEEPLVFQVSEIDSEYEFDAPRWHDFSREELDTDSRLAQLWFRTAQSYPPSPFAIKLLLMMEEEISDDKIEPTSKAEDGEVVADVRESDREQPDVNKTTGNGISSGVFTFLHGGTGTLDKVPNQSLHDKGPTLSNHKNSDQLKCRPKPSTRPVARTSTLMKPTASQLAKQENIRLHIKVKENGLFHSTISEAQAVKRQKLDGGLLRKVAEKKQEMIFFHKALKKDGNLDKNSHLSKTKITIPHEPHFATSQRANRIRHKDDAKVDPDSTSVYRFKARPFNRKIFEAPSLPIRKKSTPKLPEFLEFHLKTSERAMQHSSVVSTLPNHKGSDKPDKTALVDGVNREPRRPRAADIHKDDDRKRIAKGCPPNSKILSTRRDTGMFRKSKRETTVPLAQSEKRVQPDLPTDLFSKLSLTSELQQNNGSRVRFPQPEQGSKDNKLNSFQSGNERTSKATGKPLLQRDIWTARRSVGIRWHKKEKPSKLYESSSNSFSVH